MLRKPQIASVVAEFLGTAIFVLVAVVLTETTAVSYFIGTSVAVALAVVYMIFGPISGGHFNPAVTFSMWTTRMFSTLRAASYIAAQMLGALAALELYQYFLNRTLPAKNMAFSTPMFLAEVVGTAIVVMALTGALKRGYDAMQTAITYGAAFFVATMIAATASSASLNPATALALRNWNAIYVLGPLVGGLIGANLYMWLFADGIPVARSRFLRRRK